MICHLKFIFAWILFLPQLTDGATVTWYEPTPVQTTSNPAEALIPGKLAVYEGSSATLNWNYSLSSVLTLVQLRFKGVFIVAVLPTGQAGPVNASFRQRFSVSSTPQSVSLLISKVTAVDDKSNGEFSCELDDLPGATWRRAIQVQVEDGATVTWYEPTPVQTTSNPAEALIPGKLAVYEGSSATLNWNYRLSLTLTTIKLRFKGVFIVNVLPTGQAGPVNASFRQRFSVSSTPQSVSLLISKVTAVDDKSNGEFSCELDDLPGATWRRAIQVQVVVPTYITGISGEPTVLQGDNLQLTCEVSGRPEPNITWIKEKPGNQGNTVVVQEGKLLTITDINRTDAGDYTCTAYNGFGKLESRTVYVIVTNPAKIVNFQNEYFVVVQQSVTLNCGAEGNPPPTYTWIPCDPEQVCNKKTLDISQVLNDASYTCRVANVHGSDTKTAIVYIAGKVINITIVITSENCVDEKYNKSSLPRKLEEELKRAFAGRLDYERVQSMSVRCGSIIVDLALKFNSTTKEQDVIITLNDALKDGKLGEYSVGSIKGKRPNVEPTGEDATPPPNGSYGDTVSITVGAVFGSVAALVVAGILVWWTCRKKRRNTKGSEEVAMGRRTFRNSSNEGRESTNIAEELPKPSQSHYMALDDRARPQVIADASPLSSEQISEYASLVPYTRSFEIPREHVTIKQIVGKGAFSQVAKATADNLQGRTKKTLVAVKMLSENASESEKKNLLSELELMKQLKPHPYVIKLLGCVTKSEPLLVLIEYVPFGDLLGYLRKSRGLNDTYYKDPNIKPQTNLTSQQLMKFAWQIADGMSYLSSIPVIHRDLSARNVLVGEGKTCKVTDFGMARDVQEDNIYERKTRGRLPVKWTAIEALLYGKYSTKSDLWSYGILLYEIFTIGGSPYPRMDGRKIANLLQEGYRMPKPQHLDDKLYEIMKKCWRDEPNLRPSFEELRNKLSKMENQHKGLINLKNYDHQLYVNVEDLAV
ncbi:fibroblast growth factor receptor 2 [Pocillopora verrucosa]|uniref:fibroblast growth factor receptor 2 n=1 Tax=Pocillopora verrucosa TaxID=203993 RepID=UPI00333FD957